MESYRKTMRKREMRGVACSSVLTRLVGSSVVARALELHLEALHADLEAVHRLDGGGGGRGALVRHET